MYNLKYARCVFFDCFSHTCEGCILSLIIKRYTRAVTVHKKLGKLEPVKADSSRHVAGSLDQNLGSAVRGQLEVVQSLDRAEAVDQLGRRQPREVVGHALVQRVQVGFATIARVPVFVDNLSKE